MKSISRFAIENYFTLILIALAILAGSCNQSAKAPEAESSAEEKLTYEAPEWSKNAIIYEVNIRQYTPEGTFKAFETHLPRLKNLGVDILWLMPIHPIGEENRKGSMGSYYAVKDYKAVNPEFGTLEDLKSLVNTAHDMGFYVILDWVANHSAWDNPWIYEHPEWYTKDSTGKIIYPSNWTDVADLNYDNVDMRNAMTDALKFWVVEANIDGYRCDVASDVPTDYWESAREELTEIKPLFMLAEAEKPEHHNMAFDMSYAWELHHIFNEVAKGNMNADSIEDYFVKNDSTYPADAYRMAFITNHDENSWNGTVEVRMGPAVNALAVLSYTLPGMPLIYSGQEVGLNKALEFFEKDEIDWNLEAPQMEFYTSLNALKKDNEALWNGKYGGEMQRINTSGDEKVLAFTRTMEENRLLIVTNLSDENLNVVLLGNDHLGDYVNYFTGEEQVFLENTGIGMTPWDYRIFVRNGN